MQEFDPNTIQIAIYGIGSVGALSVSFVIVNWLKTLLCLEGQAVRYLNTGVAAYVVAMLYATQYIPDLALGMGGLYLIALIASATSGLHAQSKKTE